MKTAPPKSTVQKLTIEPTPTPTPLLDRHLHATVSSHPRRNIPQGTIRSPPYLLFKAYATLNKTCRHEGMIHKMTRKLPVGMHVQLY